MATRKLMALDFDTLASAKATLLDMAVHFGPRLVVALLIIGFGLVVGRWVARALLKALQRIDMEPPVRQLLTRLARMLVLMLFVLVALQNLGVEMLPLIAGMGVAGAGIALAMQGVLSNVMAGLTIIFTKPYRVGEYVSIAGVEGRVETVSVFNTELVHGDRSRVVVPNRKVVGEILHNYGRIRQADLQLGVAFGTDLTLALQIINAVVRAHPRVLPDPAPVTLVVRIAPSSVQIAVKPWMSIADYGVVESELIVQLLDALRQRSIVVPVPQQDVRLIGGS